jgi:DNA-binding NtrC family response regulator
MVRPCFLVLEREYEGNLSARKLVIETAKLNVITCYASREAIETLRRYPNITAAVISTDVDDVPCAQVAREMKSIRPDLPIVVISPHGHVLCDAGDYRLSSHDPQELLNVLRRFTDRAAA